MFDEYARELIALLPALPDIDRSACRRALSAAYFYIVRNKLGLAWNADNLTDLRATRQLLRQMIDSLESVAVFDRLNGQVLPIDVEAASAFVAAEALFLLGELPVQARSPLLEDPILQESTYSGIEAAILYMIGGYDVDAVSVVKDLKVHNFDGTELDSIYAVRLNNANALLLRLQSFCLGKVRQPRGHLEFVDAENYAMNRTNPEYLVHKVRSNFYQLLGVGIDAYLDWLGGYAQESLEVSVQTLRKVRNAAFIDDYPTYTEFADIYHLSSLLLAAIEKTSRRALVHNVPVPAGITEERRQEFMGYLRYRARGDEHHRGRPFLWPSAIEYIENCMPGPNRDAVISMPTGSGKGYVAELAVTHALQSGWVLYLAPTNTLVHQVRRDLIYALRPFQEVSVRAFIGSEEYTTLSEEQITILDNNFVAVMTPEKCSLALRLYPEKFANCSLCVFDECHLLNDNNRGITADILLAQLSLVGHAMHFILMSAMVSNPEDLAQWLGSIHDVHAVPLNVKWRPSRTMRGLLLIDRNEFDQNFEEASELLRHLPARRRNQKFSSPLAVVTGLSGPWTLDGTSDYRISGLPISFDTAATRSGNEIIPTYDSWKNTSSRQLAELLAQAGMPTICFILTSRHHTFSAADKIIDSLPDAIGNENDFPELVEAWLAISDAELGSPTLLRALLRRGVAVHSSAMLQTEQAASEWMFLNGNAQLIFATGTLAQGLNLPAAAVVIAGTSMGDPRDQDEIAGVVRVNSMILNGFGRAGRPGFSNQGLAILVSDSPYKAQVSLNLDPSPALNQYAVLGEEDAAIEVHSPVETFIDNLIASDLNLLGASKNELVLTSLLAEYDGNVLHSGQILVRTFAAYHKRALLPEDSQGLFRDRINRVREDYFGQPEVPTWLNKTAMEAGVEYFRALRMWQAYNEHGLPSFGTALAFGIDDWLNLFMNILALLPPKQILMYLPDPEYKTPTVLTRMRQSVANQTEVDQIPWDSPNGWIELWQELAGIVKLHLAGESFSKIAQSYLDLDAEQLVNKRSKGDHPLPAVFGFLDRIVNKLAIDAGCFAAINEMIINPPDSNEEHLLEALQALPLCIRHGCDSLGTLAWYRFGYRQRICAHALQHEFPVPQEVSNDSERAEWVRQARRNWLSSDEVYENPLINSAKVVLLKAED